MEEMNNGQYFQVIDNDELQRMYSNGELVINDAGVQYGQQQVIQVQSPDQVNGPVAQQQQIQQVQMFNNQTQYVQVQNDEGVVQQHQIVYQVPGIQQEESVAEPQYILELQTPQEQAAAYRQQIQLQQQQQQQTQVQQSPVPPQVPQPQQQVVINQSPAQMPNQQQVILQSPQQILVHQQPTTPQQTQHYYVTQPTQYFLPQQQPQQDPAQQVQRIVYHSPAPQQSYHLQQPTQRIIFQQRQPTQIIQSPQQVRPQQIVQQQQVGTPTGLRIVARPQMQQIQRLQVPGQIQTQLQQLPNQTIVRQQRVTRPRQPRAQGPRQPRGANANLGMQQPSPQTVQQKVQLYRIATPQRLVTPQLQQKGAIVQRVGNNVQIKIPPGPKLVVPSPGTQVGGVKYVQVGQQPVQGQVPQKQGSEDMDDIESSITAVIVQKQGPDAVDEEFEARQAMKRGAQEMISHSTGKKPIMGPKTAIRSASSITSRSADESADRESAKMLVILKSGEQRLITFTLPKETCTVQELLEQVGVPFEADSNIRCISNPGADIDYVVTVGISTEDSNEMFASAENSLKPQQKTILQQQQQQQQLIVHGPQGVKPVQGAHLQQQGVKKPLTPEPNKNDPPPKYIRGYLAICNYCGASSLDHARCQRCKRIFKEDIKILPMPQQSQARPNVSGTKLIPDGVKRPVGQVLQKVQVKTSLTPVNRGENIRGRGGIGSGGRGRGRNSRSKPEEPVILTLSSDDEDNSSKASSNSNGNNNAKNGTNSGIFERTGLTPLKCEPVLTEEKNTIPLDFCRHDVSQGGRTMEFVCRNIRIGTHRYDPTEKVIFSTRGIRIVAPSCKRAGELIVLNIQMSEIVKLLYCFDKRLVVIFIFVLPSCGAFVRESLEMTLGPDTPYFSPHTTDNAKRKIVLLMDKVSTEDKEKLKMTFLDNKIEEITYQDANELLIRSHKDPTVTPAVNSSNAVTSNKAENLLLYPREGKGRIPINTNDYACLAIDQYLNDVIIDFYIKYVMNEQVSDPDRERTHVFSSFFYKRLTTMDKRYRATDKDQKLTAAQKRYQRVSKWNKDVDLFKKDFIIIPINEQSHWFLAIICFPRLMGPVTADGERPVKTPLVKRVKKKNAEAAAQQKKMTVTIGNTTITAMKKGKGEAIEVPGDESERDEAEGDDSELNSEDSGEEDTANPELQPIKQPCILIFDSLSGTSRSRVVATLRDYLTCEYRAKNSSTTNPIVFTKDNLPGHCLKVPQQNNFTDCGLYLLQYVEEFFMNPIKDWRLPIKGLQNWFDSLTVTKKREDISKLLEKLIEKYEPSNLPLPKLEFPTKDGVLIETEQEMDETAEFEEAETDPGEEAEEEGVKIKRRKTEESTA